MQSSKAQKIIDNKALYIKCVVLDGPGSFFLVPQFAFDPPITVMHPRPPHLELAGAGSHVGSAHEHEHSF